MVTDKELKKLQKLAKLNFTKEETSNFLSKLSNVIDMIDNLQEIDCSDIEPLRSVCNMELRMKADEVNVSDHSDDLFQNVPKQGAEFAKEVKCFVVPKVIE